MKQFCRMRARGGGAVAAHRAAMDVVNLFLDTQLKYKIRTGAKWASR